MSELVDIEHSDSELSSESCEDKIEVLELNKGIPEIWCWTGVPFDFNSFCTYSSYKYKEHPIYPKYENIRTIEDLEIALKGKNVTIDSPTSCYFCVDKNSGRIYNDQQSCVTWFLTNDGKVCDRRKRFVAKSLPEFLSHIDDDSVKWHTLFREFYAKLRNL